MTDSPTPSHARKPYIGFPNASANVFAVQLFNADEATRWIKVRAHGFEFPEGASLTIEVVDANTTDCIPVNDSFRCPPICP